MFCDLLKIQMPVNHRFYRHLSSFDFVFVELEGIVFSISAAIFQ
jgi:hypothetical protein